MNWLRFFVQFSLMPPVNINITLPRKWQQPKVVNIPPPPLTGRQAAKGFDPKRPVTNYEARILAASNSLEERKP